MISKDIKKLKPYCDKKRDRYSLKICITEGEPRKTVYGKDIEELYKNVEQLIQKNQKTDYLVSNGLNFLDLVKYNFNRRDNAGLIGDAQYVRTQRIFKRIAISSISQKNVKDLKEEDYQHFLEELSKEYSQSTLDKFYCEIRQALEYAFRKGIIKEMPLDSKIKPKSSKKTKEVNALSVEKQKILTDFLENANLENYSYKNALLLQLYMGLRIGEATALSIDDINLNNNKIHIHRTVSTDRNEKTILEEKTKTDAGTRTLPIPNNILPFIKEQIEIAKTHKNNLLFLNRNNNLVSESSVNGQLKRILIDLGIYEKGMSTHALRHTYATRCIEAGIEPVIISNLMGHADINVTLKKYVTIFNEFKAQSTKKTDEYYKKLDLLQNQNKEQKITENIEKEHSNIIQFPKIKIAGNGSYER